MAAQNLPSVLASRRLAATRDRSGGGHGAALSPARAAFPAATAAMPAGRPQFVRL